MSKTPALTLAQIGELHIKQHKLFTDFAQAITVLNRSVPGLLVGSMARASEAEVQFGGVKHRLASRFQTRYTASGTRYLTRIELAPVQQQGEDSGVTLQGVRWVDEDGKVYRESSGTDAGGGTSLVTAETGHALPADATAVFLDMATPR